MGCVYHVGMDVPVAMVAPVPNMSIASNHCASDEYRDGGALEGETVGDTEAVGTPDTPHFVDK